MSNYPEAKSCYSAQNFVTIQEKPILKSQYSYRSLEKYFSEVKTKVQPVIERRQQVEQINCPKIKISRVRQPVRTNKMDDFEKKTY